MTALFGILAALLQPMLGGLCDRNNRLTWRSMILILSVPFLVLCVIMPFIPGAWTGAVFIGMLLLLANVIMPFVNSAHFYYSQAGVITIMLSVNVIVSVFGVLLAIVSAKYKGFCNKHSV